MKHLTAALLATVLAALTAQPLSADVITFRVIDAQTQRPIEGATYEAEMRWEYSKALQTGYETDSAGRGTMQFSTDCHNVTLRVECPGYYGARRVFAISSGTDTLALGDIALRPSEAMLGSAVVTAKARRFTMHGDTVMFNPEAFQLEEGARLEDLIKKLPGVTLTDEGEMLWNGKPVRFLVQGQESLSPDLLRQLPAEAVDKIKGYNKQSEAARKTGQDDGAEDMVLDLQIKEGWLDKWSAEIETQGVLPVHALAKFDALRLGTKEQTMVFADWNNLGKRFGRSVTGKSESNYGLGRQTYGAGGWYKSWMMPRAKGEDKSTFTINADLDHFDIGRWSEEDVENFLPGAAFSRSRQHRDFYSHSLQPNLRGQLLLRPDSANTLSVDYGFSLSKNRSHSDTELTRYDDADAPISQQSSHSESCQQGGSAQVGANYRHFFADESNMALNASAYYNHYDNDNSNTRHIDYVAEGRQTHYLQTATGNSHLLRLNLGTSYSRWFSKNVLLNASYGYRFENSHSRQNMYNEALPDAANSYRRRDVRHTHTLSLDGTMNFKPFQIMPILRVQRNVEHLDYLRGSLDTAATRSAWIMYYMLRTVYKINQQNKLELFAEYGTSQPDIIQTLGYTDTTDPLNTSAGNPSLHNSHSLSTSLDYTANMVRHQRVITAGIAFSRDYSPVQNLVAYNPQSGAYHTTFANVRGGTSWELRASFDQGLGEHMRLRFQRLRAIFQKTYGYLTDTGQGFVLNSQRSHGFSGGAQLSYERDTWEVMLQGGLEYSGLRNNAADDYDLYEYSFGITALWKFGKFELTTDFTDLGRRGYASSGYNRDRLHWNAAIAWKFMQGKGRLTLSAQDILNQADPIYAYVSASERSEYRWEHFHRYVALSFSLRLEPKKKNKPQPTNP